MKKINFRRFFSFTIIQLIGTLFSISVNAQDSDLIFSWDKLGCQNENGSAISLDSINNSTCLKVCENTIITYVISGNGVENISEIEWLAEGGEVIESRGLSAPILWHSSVNGSINIHITFKGDAEPINKFICIGKDVPELVLSWDKIGCQSNKNHVSEIKFDDYLSNENCLLVCKSSTLTYAISGNSASAIDEIHWFVQGGTVQDYDDDVKAKIVWGEDNIGSIGVYIKLLDGTVIDETICVYIIDSSLMLEWEKIEESSVSEIKYDSSPDDTDTILMYPDSVSIYKIGGKNSNLISDVFWDVKGGYAYNSHGLSTPITWYDEEINELKILVTFLDDSTMDRDIKIVNLYRIPPGGNTPAQNSIKFTYEPNGMGNQIKREMIYLSKQSSNITDDSAKMAQKKAASQNLTKSSEYPDISYYPNPVKSELFITWENSKQKKLSIIEMYNYSGQMIKKLENLNDSNEYNILFWTYPVGIYNLILIYTNGERKTLSIIKK